MVSLRTMNHNDWQAVANIYEQGIATGLATFETNVPSWEIWDNGHLQQCRLVAEIDNEVVGWAALTGVSGRCVYAGVAEVSVYVSQFHKGMKIGSVLLEALIREAENNNFWTLQSGIFRENEASIALHKKCGFREVGYREKIGQLNGVWRDTVLMERRSENVKFGFSTKF
ncbi:MAG: N-acetyltransferase [Cytophagales bacterium CG12_big_fil_rev_8_21_14_0_65_40_12]|nr:MAG: N-acetyltransferase [Cytophagales bacterium CG12_big_fil_rev_8_21_14_0_65_40_12]PIW02911.1 MAG: N-acetyltransferase [Cytophagales bacterium CG17_big_fil_post_rev_8_21_14_2_50_40_13]